MTDESPEGPGLLSGIKSDDVSFRTIALACIGVWGGFLIFALFTRKVAIWYTQNHGPIPIWAGVVYLLTLLLFILYAINKADEVAYAE